MINVLLVDDQPLVRAGLRLILESDADLRVIGECDDGDEVLERIAADRPDVVVMDVRMKRVDGVRATQLVRARTDGPPVLVLTTFGDDEVLSEALRAGASGFQLKDASGEELIRAVRSVARGAGWLDPAVTARVLATYRGAALAPIEANAVLDRLTTREKEVLQLIGRGATNAEIAERLYVGEVTVKTHVGHIFSKLGVRDRAAAIVFAFDSGLVTPAS